MVRDVILSWEVEDVCADCCKCAGVDVVGCRCCFGAGLDVLMGSMA
jgi:hypothetical protein